MITIVTTFKVTANINAMQLL